MQERVQLNIAMTAEQKLALQALAEGRGTSVTKLVLGLIDQAVMPQLLQTPREAAEAVKKMQQKNIHQCRHELASCRVCQTGDFAA